MRKIKILELTSVDFVVKNLLLPLIDRLSVEGYEVNVICSDGKRVRELKSADSSMLVSVVV